jgi:hypothetical protein
MGVAKPRVGSMSLIPLLHPANWAGAQGNDTCRRLVGAPQDADIDPVVSIAVAADDRPALDGSRSR